MAAQRRGPAPYDRSARLRYNRRDSSRAQVATRPHRQNLRHPYRHGDGA
jgi:hypothetical protein